MRTSNDYQRLAVQPGAVPINPAQSQSSQSSQVPCPEWTSLIGPDEWAVYRSALEAMRQAEIPVMLGGAFGLATYTGRWRNTKDLDLYLLPAARERAIQALSEAGFTDYYAILPYDRGWIYRATRNQVIVDLIWGTPNRRSEVDPAWFERASKIQLRTEVVAVAPAEELACVKLYVLQRDRCDWPDIINLLYARGASLDWDHLVERLGDDLSLLLGLLTVFAWVCPDRAEQIPPSLRQLVRSPVHVQPGAEAPRDPIKLLDSRPWFAAHQPCDQPMQL